MLLRAFAKINLHLEVLGRRDDGYHEVRTLLQTIDWFDEIRVELSNRFYFSGPGTPEDETNLVVRAVRAYEKLSGVTANVRVDLTKNIPVGRGLGGGSADAAVTFLGLHRLFKASISHDDIFRALGALGSDVPFFVIGGLAAGSGRGDILKPLGAEADYWLVLVDSGVNVATGAAYSWLTLPDKSNSIEGFCAESISGSAMENWRNDFEPAVFSRYPELADIKADLLKLGAWRAALSGSGSAIFGQFRKESEAFAAAAVVDQRLRVKVTKPLPRSEYFHRMIEG